METPLHNTTIEVLTEEHLEWFVEIAAVNMLEDEVKRPELVNLEALYHLARQGMETETAFIAKIGNIPVGAIGGLLLPNIFNPTLTSLVEVFWYVLPEYRNSRAGLLLLNAFTKAGEDKADDATLCLLSDSPIHIKTLEKRGYVLSEFAFRKDNRNL